MFSSTTIASSTTRPTATAMALMVMMLSVMPCAPRIRIAVKIESGMLTAVTSVVRTVSRKTKMTRMAKTAPKTPSRTRLLTESLMLVELS